MIFKHKMICFLVGLLFISGSVIATEVEPGYERLGLSYLDIRSTDDLSKIKQRRILRALVVPGRTDFYLADGQIKGMMVKLLDNYEKHLNKGIKKEDQKTRIVYIPVNFDDLIPALQAGMGDIAADFLTITDHRKQQIAFASGRSMSVNEIVVTNRNSDFKLSKLEDLAGRIVYVLKGSSYVEHLQQLNEIFTWKELDPIKIIESEEYLTGEDILEMLNAGAVDITVVDDFRAELWSKVLPNIELKKDLIVNAGGAVGWGVRKDNSELQKSLQGFIKKVKKGTLLGNTLFNQFYGRDQKLGNLKLDEEREKYTQHAELFEKYAAQYEMDHFKLLAQGYQESRLNQKMRSHRGAVGIMQLLPSTAKDKNVAINNIDQLENNIHAGAKYMDFLKTRYFSSPDISADNQIFFSWAAYNAGPANVRKMRNLAEKMGLDRNVWFNNVEVAAGRLIGTETVRYVANIYKYYSTYLLIEEREKHAQLPESE